MPTYDGLLTWRIQPVRRPCNLIPGSKPAKARVIEGYTHDRLLFLYVTFDFIWFGTGLSPGHSKRRTRELLRDHG